MKTKTLFLAASAILLASCSTTSPAETNIGGQASSPQKPSSYKSGTDIFIPWGQLNKVLAENPQLKERLEDYDLLEGMYEDELKHQKLSNQYIDAPLNPSERACAKPDVVFSSATSSGIDFNWKIACTTTGKYAFQGGVVTVQGFYYQALQGLPSGNITNNDDLASYRNFQIPFGNSYTSPTIGIRSKFSNFTWGFGTGQMYCVTYNAKLTSLQGTLILGNALTRDKNDPYACYSPAKASTQIRNYDATVLTIPYNGTLARFNSYNYISPNLKRADWLPLTGTVTRTIRSNGKEHSTTVPYNYIQQPTFQGCILNSTVYSTIDIDVQTLDGYYDYSTKAYGLIDPGQGSVLRSCSVENIAQ